MILVFRKLFLIALAMLQLVAPLVHGHTGEANFNQGIHIPGLEGFSITQDAPVFQDVNQNWECEGLLVVIDAGIKNPPNFTVVNQNIEFALLTPDQFPLVGLPKSDNNFSPHIQTPSFRSLFSTQSPRAPPTLSFSL